MDTTTRKTQRTRASLPEELSLVYTEETELHWHRIITAVLIVVALLTAIGWILMNSISAQKAAEVISAQPAVEESRSDEGTAAAAEIEPKIQQLDEAIPEIPRFEETPPVPAQEQPQTVAPNLIGQVLPLYAYLPDKPALQEPPVVIVNDFLQAPLEEDLVQVTRDPFFVGSLQLTSGLEDKSPTDQLSGEIKLGDRQLVKIYAYSELTNLKGEQVYHEWYQGDKRVARIPVGVYLDDMRASSSKYIDKTMLGDWRLEITRANGQQLGRMDFRVNADT